MDIQISDATTHYMVKDIQSESTTQSLVLLDEVCQQWFFHFYLLEDSSELAFHILVTG